MGSNYEESTRKISNSDLFQKWVNIKNLKTAESICELEKYVVGIGFPCGDYAKQQIVRFYKNVNIRWKKSPSVKKFKKKHNNWLIETALSEEKIPLCKKPGRPQKKFGECSARQKRQKVKEIVKDSTLQELSFATQLSMRKFGERSAATVLKTISSPTRARKVQKAIKNVDLGSKCTSKFLTADEALSLIINTKSKETARLFVQKYPWYYMPVTVHKILVHGADIIEQAILPIGQLGEEAQEAKNKDFKFIREHRTRKDSINHTNQDLFNFFILSSDPIISSLSLQNASNQKKNKLKSETLELLIGPMDNNHDERMDSSSDNDSD